MPFLRLRLVDGGQRTGRDERNGHREVGLKRKQLEHSRTTTDEAGVQCTNEAIKQRGRSVFVGNTGILMQSTFDIGAIEAGFKNKPQTMAPRLWPTEHPRRTSSARVAAARECGGSGTGSWRVLSCAQDARA